jgi:hypothetical protein
MGELHMKIKDLASHIFLIFALLVGVASMVLILFLSCNLNAGVPSSWTVEDSIKKGMAWGGKKIRKGVRRMWEMHYPTYWRYGGGRDPVSLALLTLTETGWTGNPLSATNDTVLGEAGLLSMKRALARTLDLDACDAPQCVWGASKGHQMRRDTFLSNYTWMQNVSQDDQDFVMGMVGGAGAGAANCFLKGSQARETCAAKGWKNCSIQNIVYGWIREEGNALAGEKYDHCWGRTDAETAVFRVFRIASTKKVVIQVYGGGKKGKARRDACTRPESILDVSPFGTGNYPGNEAHGQCAEDPAYVWNLPPAGHRKKNVKGKLVDLWGPYCPIESNGSCSYTEHVYPAWMAEKQMQGLIAGPLERLQVEMEMRAAGCWILD